MYSRLASISLFTLCLLGNMAFAANASKEPFGNICAQISPSQVLGLSEAIDLALCNNPQTKEAWANVQAQSAQIGINSASLYPSIALNASANHNWLSSGIANNQQSIGLSASYLLYDFGARSASVESAYQLLNAASATQDSTLQNVFLSAVQAYYQTQATSAALDAAQISEQSAKESYAAAQARYAAGTATPADKLSAQTAYSQATLNRLTAEGTLKKAQGTLANLLGWDANREIRLEPVGEVAIPGDFSANVGTLIEQARQHRPDLQAAIAQAKAAQANIDAARAANKPTISLSASGNRNLIDGNSNHAATLGINVSVPLFSGYAPTYRVRAAEAQAEAKNAQRDRLQLQVALDVWTAYQNLNTATQSQQTTADLLESATQSEHAALGRYKAGLGNMLDVLNAQSTLANARQQRVQALLNWNISRTVLAQAMGRLDSNLLQAQPIDTTIP
jgi:TolC family type I secretion outer membrane protein